MALSIMPAAQAAHRAVVWEQLTVQPYEWREHDQRLVVQIAVPEHLQPMSA